MGETHETETMPLPHETGETGPAAADKTTPTTTTMTKTRRNGMWNIFEGVDNTVLEKLGLSEDIVHQLVTEADHTVFQHLANHLSDEDSSLETGGCRCRKARILRSFSATVGEDMKAALQSRRRRNAVGNLFDVLTASQKLLLVEYLQEQLERLHCLCGGRKRGGVKPTSPTASTTTEVVECVADISGGGDGSSEGTIILDLTEFTAASTSPPTSSSSSSSASQSGSAAISAAASSGAKEEVACH